MTFKEFMDARGWGFIGGRGEQLEYDLTDMENAWDAAVEACAKLAHNEGQLIKDANDPAWIVARDIERSIRALKVSE